jgi:hypothetical protein
MAHLTISVPDNLVDDLRRALLRAHADRGAAVRRALDAYLVSRERLDDVEGGVVELVDLHDALVQVGWGATARSAGRLALSAHPELLADGLQAAARARVARLLVLSDSEAAVVLGLAGGRHMALADLQAELDLSLGGARAFAAHLEHLALTVREPDPRDPLGVRFRLSTAAETELEAALSALGSQIRELLG